jgi:hypothetical protein
MMGKPIHAMSSWEASSQALPSTVPAEEWEATQAQTALATQLLRTEEDYLADAAPDIGRHIDDRHHELFVSCDPGQALRQQLEVLRPDFIAIHDVGTVSSRRLVAGIAAAVGRPVQKLLIRRQGFGVGLATIEFAELPAANGARPLRLYTTEIDADTPSRRELAHALLAYSRLGVVMVGELPAHALAAALQPISEAITRGPWPNQNLLMLPLASASSLASQATTLGHGRVTVRTTPQVTKPADAWNYLTATWNRVREQLAAAGVTLPAIGSIAASTPAPAAVAAPAAPVLPMQPMPAVPTKTTVQRVAPTDNAAEPLTLYVTKLLEITGMVSACVFETTTQRSVAHAGARPGPAMLAVQGAALSTAILEASRALGFGATPPDAAITLGAHHLIVRGMPGRPGVLLHAVLDKTAANLTLARLQILRLDSMLEAAAPA